MFDEKRDLWPWVRDAIEMVSSRQVSPHDMISALLLTAIYFAFRADMDRRQFLHLLLGKWAEMELADGRAAWCKTAES